MIHTRYAKGFGGVEIFLVVLVVGLLGGAGWYVYNKNSSVTNSSSQNTVGSGTSQQPKTAGVSIGLHSLGVKFTPSANLGTLLYKEGITSENIKYAVFSTDELTKIKDANGNNFCNTGDHVTGAPTHLGYLFKVDGAYPSDATDENTMGVLIKQFNGFNLQFRKPGENCFQDQQNQARAAALDQILIDSLKSSVQLN